jgi:hypothetical protein
MTKLEKELEFKVLTLNNTVKYLERTRLISQRDRLVLEIEELMGLIKKEKTSNKPKKMVKKKKGRK